MKKEMLEKILINLFNGEEVVLSTRTNQYGEEIDDFTVKLVDGDIYFRQIGCLSSESLGMGNCQCISHDPIDEYWVAPKNAIPILLDKIEEIEKAS